jgi:deoxyribonuclease (pyrimidine dimer)
LKPNLLADQHLFAEWREIKMVPASLRRSLKTKSVDKVLASIPEKFTLNSGHVLFFYDKLSYLVMRYRRLYKELVKRGYKVPWQEPDPIFYEGIPKEFIRAIWWPTQEDGEIVKQRIREKVAQKPEWYRYYGVKNYRL